MATTRFKMPLFAASVHLPAVGRVECDGGGWFVAEVGSAKEAALVACGALREDELTAVGDIGTTVAAQTVVPITALGLSSAITVTPGARMSATFDTAVGAGTNTAVTCLLQDASTGAAFDLIQYGVGQQYFDVPVGTSSMKLNTTTFDNLTSVNVTIQG